MPTGFTDKLEKRDWDLQNWLKVDLARGLGLCVMLRDDGDMDQQAIAKALKEEREDNNLVRCAKRLKNAKSFLVSVQKKTMPQWRKEWKALSEKQVKAKAEYIAEMIPKTEKWNAAVTKLQSITPKGEVASGAVRLALDQLATVRTEFSVSNSDIEWMFSCPPTAEDLRDYELKRARDAVKYNQKDYDEAKKASLRTRFKMYTEFVEEVDSWFRGER